jgi:hypothetical protein
MPLIPSVVRAVLVGWSVATTIVSSSSVSASAGETAQEAKQPARASPWACRLIAVSTVRPVVEKGMERSATIRRQCEELAAARAVVVLEWGAMDSHTQARTAMEIRAGVVVASVKLPPLGDIIVLMAHELQHVIEQTRGLDLRAEAQRAGSGVWQSFGAYETQAAVDVSRQVAEELRAYSRAGRHRRD